MELPLMINPTGSARSEPKVSTQCKRYGGIITRNKPQEAGLDINTQHALVML